MAQSFQVGIIDPFDGEDFTAYTYSERLSSRISLQITLVELEKTPITLQNGQLRKRKWQLPSLYEVRRPVLS